MSLPVGPEWEEPTPNNPLKQRETMWTRPVNIPPESIRNLRALATHTSGVIVAVVRSLSQQALPESERPEPSYIVEAHAVNRVHGRASLGIGIEMLDFDLDGSPLPATPRHPDVEGRLLTGEDIVARGRFVGRFGRNLVLGRYREQFAPFITTLGTTREWSPGRKRGLLGDRYASDGYVSDLDDEPVKDRMTPWDEWVLVRHLYVALVGTGVASW